MQQRRSDGVLESNLGTEDVANSHDQFLPQSELEYMGRCPICSSGDRETAYSGLTDGTFGVAPGKWQLWKCGGCSNAYLDPRFSQQSIARAYGRYYTHDVIGDGKRGQTSFVGLWIERLRRGLRNGFVNARFGHRLPNANPIGRFLPVIMPERARHIEHGIRHLPKPAGHDSALLDVGCGNGEWLFIARELGFQAFGLDPDPKAVVAARSHGFDVEIGALPGCSYKPESFDHITLSHVFEHLHWHVAALQELYALLKPGGRLWMSMPNLGAQGLTQFGRFWRGLEPPRHLALFSTESLRDLVEAHGFVDVSVLPSEDSADFFFRQSLAISSGILPSEPAASVLWTVDWAGRARAADRRARDDPSLAEIVTVVGFKAA